jgi:hypothetical protein
MRQMVVPVISEAFRSEASAFTTYLQFFANKIIAIAIGSCRSYTILLLLRAPDRWTYSN